MKNYPDPKFFPDEETHLLFDIGYGYALMHRAKALLEEVKEALAPGQTPLLIEVEKMLEGMREFNEGRLQSIDRVYAVVGKALELSRTVGSASIDVKLPPNSI